MQVLACAVLLAVPVGASAQQELCSAAANHVCVTAEFVLSSSNTLEMYLFNGSSGQGVNWQSTVTGLELAGLPTVGTWSLTSVGFNDWNGTSLVSNGNTALASLGNWAFSTSTPGLVGIAGIAGASGPGANGGAETCDIPSGGNGVNYSTCQGGGLSFGNQADWLLFTFTYSAGALTQGMLADIDWGYKAQRVEGNGGSSVECQDSDHTKADFCSANDVSIPQEATPEPSAVVMMATGLVGMTGFIRRRRKA
jgi:hypothetical protein